MTIKIPVSADFDPSGVEKQMQDFQRKLDAMGAQIAKVNKTQFNPISKTSLQDMERMVKQFEALKKISGDLNKRINATGQKGASFVDLDWAAMYPDHSSRQRQMAKAFAYITGQNVAPSGGGGSPNKPSGAGWGAVGANAIQAGLRASNGATGGVGGVGANAIGTGMSAGFGAGMMGLLGGLLALGVGKIVGAAVEKIGQAEDNAVAYDKLKRTIGDVNVSFGALKAAVIGAADANKITYSESIKLTTQFAKLSNATSANYKSLPGEVGLGIGMSRAYGLDPEEGVGILGRMRGIGVSKNEQDTRRFALLIGETIGKSNAFAKADEVMAAIADFATMQTRSGMGSANVRGYAGAFSSLTASGIPGLDPTGTGSLLSRINASLTAGGAKGEASQFFSAMIGNRMGLDPLQLQVLREGGAFATNSEAFGPGSIAARYGLSGPGGDKTFLSQTLDGLRGAYGSNKGLLAQATANHLGINMRQAMAILSINPNQMGDMGKYADLTKLSGSGIGNLSKALYGTDADRLDLSNNLAARTGSDALSPAELKKLDAAMAGGDVSAQKQVLAELVATRDQERTQGSDIRDSKNALDNIKTTLSDKMLPLTQAMRDGIMWMAGGKDGKSAQTIQEDMAKADISEKYQRKIDAERARFDRANLGIDSRGMVGSAYATQGAKDRKIMRESYENIGKLKSERDAEIEKTINGLRNPASMPADSSRSGAGRYGSAPTGASLEEKLAAADAKHGLPPGTMKSIMSQETGGSSAFLADPSKYHYGLDANGRRVAPHTGKISTAFGPFGILESTAAKPGYGVSPLAGKDFDSQLDFAAAYAAARIRKAGSVRGGLAGYGEGFGYATSVAGRIGTPMPEDAAAAKRSSDEKSFALRGSFDPLAITVQSPDGRPMAPTQYLNPNFNIPTFGVPH